MVGIVNQHKLDLLWARLDVIDAKLDNVLKLLEKQEQEAVTEWHRGTVMPPYDSDIGRALTAPGTAGEPWQ